MFANFLLKPLSYLLVAVTCYWGGNGFHRPVVLAAGEDDLVVLNGCVISACNYLAVVKAKNTLQANFWAKVLLVRYSDYSSGHAYAVWETDGTVYGYDRNSGGFPIPAHTHDPRVIATVLAEQLAKILKRPLTVSSAEFVEPNQSELHAF